MNQKATNRITFHIGLPKTGTTYLQKQIFPYLPNVDVVEGWHSHRQLMRTSLENMVIISDEEISGWLWNGSSLQDFYPNLNKIRNIYKNPKIIFGIRNHENFILSVYKQYLHEKGYRDFDFLFNLQNTGLLKHEDLFLMPKINFLKNNFEDVFIYSQESLRKREEDFTAALKNFLEINADSIPVNQKQTFKNEGVKTALQVKTLKKLNKINARLEKWHPKLGLYSVYFYKLKITPRRVCQNYLKKVKSKKFDVPESYKKFIKENYTADWLEAQKHISY